MSIYKTSSLKRINLNIIIFMYINKSYTDGKYLY
jgi:hypothetical protein